MHSQVFTECAEGLGKAQMPSLVFCKARSASVTIGEERMRAVERKKKENGKMALLEAFRVRILFYALILCKQINPKSIVRLLEKRDVIEYKVYMSKTQTQFFFCFLFEPKSSFLFKTQDLAQSILKILSKLVLLQFDVVTATAICYRLQGEGESGRWNNRWEDGGRGRRGEGENIKNS